jgi:hypothetical protein
MPTRAERLRLIQDLQDARDGRALIAYVTSTRANLSVSMSMDAIPHIHRHLRALGLPPRERARVDLFLHSDGGDGTMPWRLITLLREFAAEVCVLVPHRAFSAATLCALGANEVVMHPMGMLGPIDPTVHGPFNPSEPGDPSQRLGISVEDVAAYINLVRADVGITHEDELVQAFNLLADRVHPLALGNVKRVTNQSRMLAGKLLNLRGSSEPHRVEEIIDKLGTQLYYHGHPINRVEAREQLGLDFVKNAAPRVEEAMWRLYEAYVADMSLETDWQPVMEVLAQEPLPPPPPLEVQPGQLVPPPPQVSVRAPAPVTCVRIESEARCDVREARFEVTLIREWSGKLTNNTELVADDWVSL